MTTKTGPIGLVDKTLKSVKTVALNNLVRFAFIEMYSHSWEVFQIIKHKWWKCRPVFQVQQRKKLIIIDQLLVLINQLIEVDQQVEKSTNLVQCQVICPGQGRSTDTDQHLLWIPGWVDPDAEQRSSHSRLLSKLLSLPPQPPKLKLSQRPVTTLKNHLGMAARQPPVSLGRRQTKNQGSLEMFERLSRGETPRHYFSASRWSDQRYHLLTLAQVGARNSRRITGLLCKWLNDVLHR